MIRQVKKGGKTLEYDLRRTERRSLECRMSEEGAVLFAPMRTKTSEADAFILQHFDRIMASLERLKKNSEAREKQLSESLTDGALIPVEGRPHALRLKPGARLAARIANGEIIVTGAGGDAEKIREAVRSLLINRAKLRFQERAAHFARIIGVSYGQITIREQKTKWGSCSSRKNLNFNWRLIMAPPGALDYVVVHELCHLIEMNHSPAFWAQVEKYMPAYREWKAYLAQGIRAPI